MTSGSAGVLSLIHIWVKVTDIDEKGRVNLSHIDAIREIKAKKLAKQN